MRKSYKIALPALLAAGLLTAPGALTSAASASTTQSASAMALTLDSGSCEAIARRFLCEVSFSGATAPVAIRWFVNGNHIPAFDNRSFVGIGCQPTFRYDIRAVVSDGSGASVQFHTTPTCRSGTP
ncbi:hypothetical protein [Nonomuraea endophytica]|uniref:Ig-like domain-containing protein n=1 Tax=Nonomuraea endophytica TaxID=714136 RepID=A0A7W8EKV6_9ACTN|nr:hypothetical protein [Nonomuraea endophytica]MBB5084655.1 hypothetical protein [Nonomuraea endophytica]